MSLSNVCLKRVAKIINSTDSELYLRNFVHRYSICRMHSVLILIHLNSLFKNIFTIQIYACCFSAAMLFFVSVLISISSDGVENIDIHTDTNNLRRRTLIRKRQL